MTAAYRIEKLARQNRKRFDCGVPELTTYLQQRASQDQKRRVSICYLLIEQAANEIAGYYTLSAGSVDLSELPAAKAKKLPRYPTVPVARVGRLAVDVAQQGKGLGGVLLADAVARALAVDMGVYAVVVDAKDEQAAAFYEHHGFLPLEQTKRTLFLPLSDAVRRLMD